jgi:hypothetical protein
MVRPAYPAAMPWVALDEGVSWDIEGIASRQFPAIEWASRGIHKAPDSSCRAPSLTDWLTMFLSVRSSGVPMIRMMFSS